MTIPADHPRLRKRLPSRSELWADGIVHGLALLAAVIGLAALLAVTFARRGSIEISAVIIYGLGMLLMFGFSMAYNLTPPGPRKWLLRRFDHSAIFLMIAGTYTPLLTQLNNSVWAWTLGAVIWTGAVGGMVMKIALPGRFDRLAILFYVLLGATALVALPPLTQSLPTSTMILMGIGGALYVSGIAFYLWHRLKFQSAIWHGFVTAAAGCHYVAIMQAMTGV
ncbi:MAG: PAQR family membrane homeostasis protein TrhA [Beijerinckiaceae bacterium]